MLLVLVASRGQLLLLLTKLPLGKPSFPPVELKENELTSHSRGEHRASQGFTPLPATLHSEESQFHVIQTQDFILGLSPALLTASGVLSLSVGSRHWGTEGLTSQ